MNVEQISATAGGASDRDHSEPREEEEEVEMEEEEKIETEVCLGEQAPLWFHSQANRPGNESSIMWAGHINYGTVQQMNLTLDSHYTIQSGICRILTVIRNTCRVIKNTCRVIN